MRARALAICLLLGGCGLVPTEGPAEIPTVQVTREVFTREVGAEGNLRPVDATQVTAPNDARGALKVAWLVADGAAVKEGEVIVRFDDTDAIKARKDGEADLQAATRRLEKERLESRQALRRRDRTAALATQEMEDSQQFQAKDADIYSRNQIVKSEIDAELAAAKVEHATTSRAIEAELSKSKIELLELSIQKAQLAIDRADQTLSILELTAPHDGIVVFKRSRGAVAQVGDTIWPGRRIAELPQLDKLEAQVFVLEADAAGLEADLPARVTLDAHPGSSWGATIKSVAKLAKPRQRDGTVQYFETILTLESVDPALMKPGARVQATLTLGGDEALVVPRQAVFERDGETIAWRRAGEDFEPVPLELGVSSPGRVTVLSGLEAGDAIAVQDPTRSLDDSSESTDGGTP